MIFLAYILAIPLAYFATLIILLFKRDRRGLGISVAFFALAVTADWWDITRSRSSTAGIGFLFLPLTAAVVGFLGLAFGRWWQSGKVAKQIAGWLALVGALAMVGITIVEGTRTIARNHRRDNYQQIFAAEVARDRHWVDSAVQTNPARARIWLDSMIRERIDDPPFLLAALPHDSISPEVLDTVANGRDLNVTLEAIRNPNTQARTLDRVYHTASYPDYFFQALAAHRNTPTQILRNLHRSPGVMTGLDIWLAGNPSTPTDVLADIAAKTTDRNVVHALLDNPSIDCPTMTALATNLMKKQNRSADNVDVQRFSEVYPTICKHTT